MRSAPFMLLAFATPAVAAAPVGGRWFTEGKQSVVEIGQCGATLCGKVVRVLQPGPGGKPALDVNNPDPKLRTRPILGITILSGFVDSGSEWTGKIYDPRAGKTYKSTLAKQPDGNLKVKGCMGPFCRSVIFTPAR